MKKTGLLALSLISLMITGCGSISASGTSASSNGESVGEAGTKEIQFWHCIGHDKMTNLNRIITKFNSDHASTDGYYVKAYQIAGSYDALHDAVKTKLNAGYVPAITMGYPDSFSEYMGSNGADSSKIINLDTLISADSSFDKTDFVSGYYNEGTQYQYSGTYSLPLYKSTEVMYYNKTNFEASAFYEAHKTEAYGNYGAILGDPTTWDWDTLLYVAKQIQAENSSVADFHALGYDSDSNLFISQMAQRNIPFTTDEGTGASHFLFMDTATGKANSDLVSLATDVYNLTTSGTLVTQGSYGAYASDLFLKKKVMFTIGSTGGSAYNEPDGAFECGLAPVPCYQNNKKYIMQGPSLCFFKTSDTAKLNATWDFYSKYVSDPTLNADLALENSYDPVRVSSYNTDDYKEWCAVAAGGYTDTSAELIYRIPNLTPSLKTNYLTSPVFIGSGTARTEIGKLVSYTKEEKGDVEKAILKAYTNCALAV